jgi:hypothetical protein
MNDIVATSTTSATSTSAADTTPRAPRPLARTLLVVGALACACSWIVTLSMFMGDAGRASLMVAMTVSLLLSEGLVWLGAALFGLKAVQARARIKARIVEALGLR